MPVVGLAFSYDIYVHRHLPMKVINLTGGVFFFFFFSI